jgi:ABC-type bacteriocin/lantibiotic exporter with double-glycine peptidase domain
MMSDDVEQNAEEVGQLRIYPCQNSPLYKCHNLSFRYSEDMGFVLHNINLTIEKGEKICIIGDSGCGKTTLIKMMLGIYPVYQGSLQWMGCEIRKVDREQLWSQVSYLSSEQYILPGSIEDNLSPGEPIDNKRWEQAVDMASLQDLVLEQSILMQNGKNLSGGQKQRIGIARVYYRGTPVLFLDEPTSAMDSESEKHCIEQILMSSYQTVIATSHRLSTLSLFDRIVVLRDGSIMFDGKFDEYAANYKMEWGD